MARLIKHPSFTFSKEWIFCNCFPYNWPHLVVRRRFGFAQLLLTGSWGKVTILSHERPEILEDYSSQYDGSLRNGLDNS